MKKLIALLLLSPLAFGIDPINEPQDYMSDAKGSPRVIYCKKAYKDLLPSQKTKFDMPGCLLGQDIDLNPEVSPSRDLAVKSKKYDSKLAKCRADFPDPKDLDAFVGCMSDPPKEYGASKSNEPSELSAYHKSQLSEIAGFESSDYETRKIEDICTDTQLIDRVRNIYLMKLKAGDVYIGQLNTKCQFNGEGTYMFGNGSEFVGRYANNKRVSGSESFPDGGVREGMSFIDNQLHGTTKFYFANGQVNQETWRNGKNIGNVMIQMSPQQVLANQQRAQNNVTRQNNLTRSEKIGNFGRCLAEGTFYSCSDSWNGYTSPPPKKVYKCEYDTFGNRISSTCTEQ